MAETGNARRSAKPILQTLYQIGLLNSRDNGLDAQQTVLISVVSIYIRRRMRDALLSLDAVDSVELVHQRVDLPLHCVALIGDRLVGLADLVNGPSEPVWCRTNGGKEELGESGRDEMVTETGLDDLHHSAGEPWGGESGSEAVGSEKERRGTEGGEEDERSQVSVFQHLRQLSTTHNWFSDSFIASPI